MPAVVPCYKTPSSLSDNGCRGVFRPLDLPGSALSVFLGDVGCHSSLQASSVFSSHQLGLRALPCFIQETQPFPAFGNFFRILLITDPKRETVTKSYGTHFQQTAANIQIGVDSPWPLQFLPLVPQRGPGPTGAFPSSSHSPATWLAYLYNSPQQIRSPLYKVKGNYK